MKDWKIWVFVISICLVVKVCAGCNGCGSNDSSSNSDSSDNAPSWIQGTWKCHTSYGTFIVIINGDHIHETLSDGSSYSGRYHIQGDDIMTESGSGVYYHMNHSSQGLSAGQGYFYEKQ